MSKNPQLLQALLATDPSDSTPSIQGIGALSALPINGNRYGALWTALASRSPTSGNLFAARFYPDDADNVAPIAAIGGEDKLGVIARLTGFDGTNFDRLRALSDNGDAQAAATLGALLTLSRLQAWNGATFDRLRTNAAAILGATTQPQALQVAEPGQWAINHAPGAATQATATRAAGAAGVRHVLQWVTCGMITGAAAAAQPIVACVVRDGAAGAGAVIFTVGSIAVPAVNDCRQITISGLNIIGTAATALTVEFLVAPGAGNFQNVAAGGYSTV